ncbi:MAG: hypothetical protein UFR15_08305, partial [Succiniclasticum sp.]|nr:hypothetical protein [Succiniclasticum sp.]
MALFTKNHLDKLKIINMSLFLSDYFRNITTSCGVYKIFPMHISYPQPVHKEVNNFDTKGEMAYLCPFFPFEHLFSVDNPVYSVYKCKLSTDGVNQIFGVTSPVGNTNMHISYPQPVHKEVNNFDTKGEMAYLCPFFPFEHLFSVDNPVYS